MSKIIGIHLGTSAGARPELFRGADLSKEELEKRLRRRNSGNKLQTENRYDVT